MFEDMTVESSKFLLFDYFPKGAKEQLFYLDMEGDFTPEVTGEYAFQESCLGTALVFVDGELLIDDKNNQVLGNAAIGASSKAQIKTVHMEAGKTYKIRIEFGCGKTFTLTTHDLTSSNGGGFFAMGYKLQRSDDDLMKEAIETAKSADKVVLCIGTSYDYESEGFDRKSMDLPGNQEKLVSEVLKANKNTIIVNQSGTPVTLPFIDSTPALVQAWFNGMESGNAIVDILYGTVNPSGKLPLTYPRKVEDNPAFLTFKSNNGHVIYGEDVFTGWKFYEKTKIAPLYPFGFGLSYTSFEFSDLDVKLVDENLVATVKITNTGSVAGKEVAQLYVVPPTTTTAVERPLKELKGFAKVALEPKETKTVTIEVPYKYAASYYDVDAAKWHAEAGEYGVLVGNSSASEKFLEGKFTLKKAELWTGL
ncbi:unnamed protein product [Ambrosiozyma monospora]|uniref:beta-glucosidase n=1 Tax=Ambrosiozyma monospora TaxID=43982 RepID=A0A9W6Z5V6_AMBMO|nr:unnamed protein product [Ambrosiozyma monospora]